MIESSSNSASAIGKIEALMRWWKRTKRAPATPNERQFYAAVARLDLSLFEDRRFVTDRPCERLGTITVSENGDLALETTGREIRQRFRQSVSSGGLEIRIGGIRDGALWDGRENLDSRYTPNVLHWLCAWNDVGVFSEATQRELSVLMKEYGIEPLRRESRDDAEQRD